MQSGYYSQNESLQKLIEGSEQEVQSVVFKECFFNWFLGE